MTKVVKARLGNPRDSDYVESADMVIIATDGDYSLAQCLSDTKRFSVLQCVNGNYQSVGGRSVSEEHGDTLLSIPKRLGFNLTYPQEVVMFEVAAGKFKG